jgi:hypothetical protein
VIETVKIKIRTEFWYLWGRIAVAEAAKASEARARFGKSGVSADDSKAMDDEINAGVVAVCAAAFSIEALLWQVLSPVVLDAKLVLAWAKNRTAFKPRLRQTLAHSLALPPVDVDKLADAFQVVVVARGAAVHYDRDFEEPVLDPMGGRTSQARIDYGKEAAGNALSAMRNIYRALVEHPKPAAQALVSEQSRALRELAGLAS